MWVESLHIFDVWMVTWYGKQLSGLEMGQVSL